MEQQRPGSIDNDGTLTDSAGARELGTSGDGERRSTLDSATSKAATSGPGARSRHDISAGMDSGRTARGKLAVRVDDGEEEKGKSGRERERAGGGHGVRATEPGHGVWAARVRRKSKELGSW
jgi:hypothetical protein